MSENAYVKCGVPIIVASNQCDEVSLFIFLGDEVYLFNSKRTNYSMKIHIRGFERGTTSHDLRLWLTLHN